MDEARLAEIEAALQQRRAFAISLGLATQMEDMTDLIAEVRRLRDLVITYQAEVDEVVTVMAQNGWIE